MSKTPINSSAFVSIMLKKFINSRHFEHHVQEPYKFTGILSISIWIMSISKGPNAPRAPCLESCDDLPDDLLCLAIVKPQT